MQSLPWEKITVKVGFSLCVTHLHIVFHGMLAVPGQVSYAYALSLEIVILQDKYCLTYRSRNIQV